MSFKSVLVAGAGTMGRGIAELMALAKMEVQLWDHRPSTLGRASAAVEKSLRRQNAIGRISEEELDEILERIRLISDLKVVHPRTDVVVEAIVEDLKLKRFLFQQIEQYLPRAWYVTSTASLRVGDISEALQRPERLIGMHFFNPAPSMPLVEIIHTVRTSKEWIRTATEWAQHDLGKQTILVRDSPGIASTRLIISTILEAIRMLEQNVASKEDIDKAMEYGYRHPMGPLRSADWMGLDVVLSVTRVLHRELRSETFHPPELLERMVESGLLGRKSGEGFYKWPREM